MLFFLREKYWDYSIFSYKKFFSRNLYFSFGIQGMDMLRLLELYCIYFWKNIIPRQIINSSFFKNFKFFLQNFPIYLKINTHTLFFFWEKNSIYFGRINKLLNFKKWSFEFLFQKFPIFLKLGDWYALLILTSPPENSFHYSKVIN